MKDWRGKIMSPSLHPDAQAILTRLKQEGITRLYHFTNVENLPSICQIGALYSKQILEERGLLSTIVTGGNPLSHSLDRTRSNWDKVSLSFTPYIPMAYNTKRSQHLCFFQINPEVAGWLNVVFTDSNATKKGHIRGLGLSTTAPVMHEQSRWSGFLSHIAEKQICDVNALQKPSDVKNGTVVLVLSSLNPLGI